MATILREVLNADQMSLAIYCQGMSKVGVNLAGTWAGTVTFLASTDGLTFRPASVTPFASGTTVQSATANGNWEIAALNYVAFKVVFARTSGSVVVTLAASLDASYQDAFLASTSKYVAQSHAAGAANVLAIAAQANRAWRLRTLVVGWSAAPAAAVLVTITDGASTVLWETYVPPGVTGAVGTFMVPLPLDSGKPGVVDGGIVNTPGNSMVITVADPGGSVVSKINAELVAA